MITGKNSTDTSNEKIGQDQEKEISVSGDARIVKESVIEKVDGPNLGNRAELENFMNEPVEVLVYAPMGRGEENVVLTSVNGRNQFIIRNVKQTIKRKYVEVLARARKNTVTADGYKDPNGEARNTVSISGGLQYPFQVLNDSNPKGPEWLRQILAENS
jgi:hypothetical protein